jgi:hypothetical protein
MRHLVIAIILCTFLGCAHTSPNGWGDTSGPRISRGSVVLIDFLQSEIDHESSLSDAQRCLIFAGSTGALDYWQSKDSGKTKDQRLREAVKKADSSAKSKYPEVYRQYGGLYGVIREALGFPEMSDAEAGLVLILGVLNGNFQPLLEF